MGYLGSALGDITAADFVNRSGNCKPTNFATLAKFKALQTQLNRVAHAKGLPKIAVDGDIGPGTIKLLASATGGNAGATCSTIAPIAEALTAQVEAIANAAGAPAKVSSPAPPSPPAIINATTGVITPQPVSASLTDALGRMSTTQMLVIAAALGGGAYLMLGKKRRRK